MVRKIIKTAIAIALVVSCGTKDRVETIKGPEGTKGKDGNDGRTVVITPEPAPVKTREPRPQPQPTYVPMPYPVPYPVPQPTYVPAPAPVPPVIIINQPWPDCRYGNDPRCRSGDTIVCACIDTYWKTIGVNVHYRDHLRIKHEGPCYTSALSVGEFWDNDCWGAPRPQPMPQPQNNRC